LNDLRPAPWIAKSQACPGFGFPKWFLKWPFVWYSGYPDMQMARKPDPRLKRTRKIRRQVDLRPSAADVEVNLCIKVSGARRRHWASEAKRRGTTMTSVIIDALVEEFGEPKSRRRGTAS
jgi:hypothetical protein